jgi:plasmid stabilization system protein ParE
MKIEYSPSVEGDLEAVADYIGRDNPRRALTFVLEIYEEIKAIGRHPLHYRLRPELGADARLARVGRYVILFRISGNIVRIERVVYGARDLGSLFSQGS